MDTLQNMRVFLHVVEAGSFTAAAQHLQITTSRTSRAVSNLEARLRTHLMNRTTRRIALTEAGERYVQRCEQILEYVDEAEAEATDVHLRPRGKLRVHAITGIGVHYVVPAIRQYQQRYPDVSIDLTLAQRMPDILDEEYDVSVVLGNHRPDSRLVSQQLGSAHSIACASPDYLERRGIPKTPSDLADHVCLRTVALTSSMEQWSFDGPRGVESISLRPGSFQVNGEDAMAIAVGEGMGIAVLPIHTVADRLKSGAIVRVMPEYALQPIHAYALYASRKYLDAKICTWVQALRDQLTEGLVAEQMAQGELTAV
jgi:DNA-binding transcriptional LysR family regulator